MVSRRAALEGMLAIAAVSAAAPLRASLGADARSRIRFGAQTNAWKVDPHHFDSLLGVLKEIRSVGLSGFETGFANVMDQFSNAAQARQRIAETGLTFFGVHIFLPTEKYDPQTRIAPASLYEKVVPGAAALGAKHLIFSSVPTTNAEELRRKAEGLNKAGRFASQSGIRVAYHNEKNQEGATELEALYAATDPQYVSFLLDCGHAYLAGVDVPAFVQKHASRIVGLHLRDFRNGAQVPLGQGTFPLEQTAAALKQVRWSGWVLNEEERTDGPKAGLKFIEPAFHSAEQAFRS